MRKSVSLAPGESKTVTFTYTPSVAKAYSVSVDGLSGSFVAVPVPEAEFVVSNLVIELAEVYIGEPNTISTLVTNTGLIAGSYEVVCDVL